MLGRIGELLLTSLLSARSVHLPPVLGVRQACLGRPGRDELQSMKFGRPGLACRGHRYGVRLLTCPLQPTTPQAVDIAKHRLPVGHPSRLPPLMQL